MPLETTGIQNFYDAAYTLDFSRDFQFRILQMGIDRYTRVLQNRMVFLTTANLPNRTINNQAVPYMGLSFNVPGSVSYAGSDAWAVTFRMPQDFSIRGILEQWSRDVFDDEISTGDYTIPGRDSVIEMALIDNAGNYIRHYTLFGVYVLALGDMAYDLKGAGAPVELQATLAYQYWRVTKAESTGIRLPPRPSSRGVAPLAPFVPVVTPF